jgi:hypothetical protein
MPLEESIMRVRRTLLLLALLGAACSDGKSPTDAAPGRDEARVGFSLNVAGTSVATISVEVTAPDITSRLVFNIEAVNGVAAGSITVPAGADRTITARAYDAKGILTHQGSKVVTVKGGANTSITITMVPAAGEQPLTISFGVLVVQVSRAAAPPEYPPFAGDEVGDTVRYLAAVRNADGTAVNGKVRWASLNPAIATVDSTGLVTARRPGRVEIAATSQGAGGSAFVTVLGDGTDGSVDQTPPKVTGVVLSADSVDIAAGDTIVDITVTITDAGSGVLGGAIFLFSPFLPGNRNDYHARHCTLGRTDPVANPASWTCRITFSPHNVGGRWHIQMRISDRGGNERMLDGEKLEASGMRGVIKVANANPDLTAPTVSGISIAPDSINLTTATDTVITVSMTAADAAAGVEWALIIFSSPGSADRPLCYAGHSLPFDTPTNQVTLSCKVALPRTLAAGTYTIESVDVHDRVGNTASMEKTDLAAGWESSFKVTK